MGDPIRELLELYTIEEALEVLEVTPYEVIEMLLRHGYAELPPFLQRDDDGEDTEDT